MARLQSESEFFGKRYESNVDGEAAISIVKELRDDLAVQKERLWHDLDNEWDKLLHIELNEDENDGDHNDDSAVSFVSVSSTVTARHLGELTQFAKHRCGSQSFFFGVKMRQLAKKFMRLCERCIINARPRGELADTVSEDADAARLYFKFVPKAPAPAPAPAPPATKKKQPKQQQHQQQQQQQQRPVDVLSVKLDQLVRLLTFLDTHLFRYEVNASRTCVNASQQDKTKLMRIFSPLVLDDFVKLVYEQLVVGVIPLASYDRQLESDIFTLVTEFEAKLRSLDFIGNETTTTTTQATPFKSIVSNVEELYVRKKCKWTMERARDLMKNADMLFETESLAAHKTTAATATMDSPTAQLLYRTLLKLDASSSSKPSAMDDVHMLRMPACAVSRVCTRVLELVYSTLDEAVQMARTGGQVRNVSMLCMVARNLFDLYACVVPTCHSAPIGQLPQLTAIVYNDFKYLAFHCLTITHQYTQLFAAIKEEQREPPSVIITYDDLSEIKANFSCLALVPELCSLGNKLLFNQLDKQQNNLMQYLNEDTNGVKDIAEKNNYELFTRALQKCIHQLSALSALWSHVLAKHDYMSLVGQLVQLICGDLVRSVLKLEDISSDDASYLHSIFVLLDKAACDLFTKHHEQTTADDAEKDAHDEKKDNGEMVMEATESADEALSHDLAAISYRKNLAEVTASKHVKSWMRFKHMSTLLKSSLAEIVDLWSEGTGPLAVHFDSEEVRHLIRALFMNTDRRSEALAKIK